MTDRAQLADLSRRLWPKADQTQQEARSAVLTLLRATAPAYQARETRQALDTLRDYYQITDEDLTDDR